MERIKLDFELTAEDYVEYSYYVFNVRITWRKKVKYILTGVSAFVILFLFLFSSRNILDSPIRTYIIILILGPLYLWIIRSKWLTRKLIQRSYARGNGLNTVGPVTVILEEDKIISRSAIGESKINWTAFKTLEDSNSYFFMFMNRKKAIIIPKRIFLLPQEQYDVKSFIERKLAEQNSNS